MEDVQQVRRQLEAHRAWEVLDDMALAVIDQTYAAVVELLGLDAPPEGGAPVRASQLVDPPDDDHPADHSPATPVLVVVEASARHCCVRLVDVDASEAAAAAAAGGDRRFGYKGIEHNWMHMFPRQPVHPVLAANRRARARASQGTVHLARVDGAGGGQTADMLRNRAGDVVVRPDVAEKGLLGVLEAMASHLDAAIRLEDGVIDAARVGGCRSLLRAPADVIKVRMLLGHMRRQVDVDAFMRRGIILRCKHGAALLFGRRRQAAEMDVDQVDEEDVLTKRLRGLQV